MEDEFYCLEDNLLVKFNIFFFKKFFVNGCNFFFCLMGLNLFFVLDSENILGCIVRSEKFNILYIVRSEKYMR